MAHPALMRVGVPHTGGTLLAAARERAYPVLLSANAFATTYRTGEREGYFRGFRRPDPEQFRGLDAALDSAGFVAAVRYGDYRFSVESYYDLVGAHPWTWHASMDYCVEPEIAGDRPSRVLRIAATAAMYWRCRAEAARRGLQAPTPVLQGYEPRDYALCAEWLALRDWPPLVGVGSVCRRHLHGPDGVLAVLEAIDGLLPAGVRLHLFGLKGEAFAAVARHPRIASADSMAWDEHARRERPTGRSVAFRAAHMHAWVERQHAASAQRPAFAGIQRQLFDPGPSGRFVPDESLALEALALSWADLILEQAIEYKDAVWACVRDGPVVQHIAREQGLTPGAVEQLEDLFGTGIAEWIERLRQERGD